MTVDLLLKRATLPNGSVRDIAVSDGRIVGIEPAIDSQAAVVYEFPGCLVSPPFIDPHFHMDATLSHGIPRINKSGTLLEGIALWGELKPLLTFEAVKQRALDYCDWAVSMGLLAIRTHVDVCDDRLLAVRALREVQREVSDYLDLQLVAFPQDGVYRSPGARDNLVRALDLGADIVGGIPHFELTMADGRRSVTDLCELAAERGLMVDMHCDETDDPLSRHIEQLAFETNRLGMGGRVTGSHLTSMHSMDNYYVSKLLPIIADSGVSVISNPLVNIIVQGQHDTYPKRRGLTRVPEMLQFGILVGWGQDCVLDPWYSLGCAEMLDVALMGLHLAQMTSESDMRKCFDMVTVENARIMGLDDLGLQPGNRASFVVLDAADPIEAIRLRPDRLLVVSKGKVVAMKSRNPSSLCIRGRPRTVNRWRPGTETEAARDSGADG